MWCNGFVCVREMGRLMITYFYIGVARGLWNMVCSLGHVVMPHGVVELLASWIGKFNKLRSYGDLEYDPSLPHVGYLEGKKCTHF